MAIVIGIEEIKRIKKVKNFMDTVKIQMQNIKKDKSLTLI